MKKTILFTLTALGLVTVLSGCGPSSSTATVPPTGFLSDYSGLEAISATSRRYVNTKYDLSKYSSFIVDPVEVYFKDTAAVGNWDDVEKLRAYMRRAVINALEPRYTAIVTKPGPGRARVRIALTNVERSAPFKLGGVSMEAELLDSQTGEQIAAVIESRQKGVPFYGYDPWSGSKAIMDDWAKRFYNRLEEARGR
ncbi:MAG: DUF3313 domain-containing protein [Planctomycetota bacterium]|jgi:hypothetical protein